MRLTSVALSAALLLGCTPVVSQRGYLPDPIGEAAIKIGTDTKSTVQDRLGDPSTQATFGGDVWYYISSVEKQISFFDPTIQTRSIMAVHFDKDGKVANIHHYGLKDGNVVAFETRTTPAKGRELTFLQQLFNATPGVPIGTGAGQGGPGGGAPGGGYP
jgi:outer membrane protein assembly factor BamE (lipoprotein component of BamABCDE complex)